MLVAQGCERTLCERMLLFAAGVGGKARARQLDRGLPSQESGGMSGHALRV